MHNLIPLTCFINLFIWTIIVNSKNSCQKSIICEPEINLNAINLNARCFALPQHGRKKY